MKKALIAVLIVVALVAWIVSWFWSEESVTVSGARPWPGGLGGLERARAQPRNANEAATTLKKLAGALPANDVVEIFVSREIERGEIAIGAPPGLPDVAAMRELLLRERVVWPHRGSIGDPETSDERGAVMRTARALVARALAKARQNDAAAWDDLLAVWKLARSLDGHPQMMMYTAAFSMARMINAVSWKMPLPAPSWLAEVQRHDSVPLLLEGFQKQTASYWQDQSRLFPTKFLADSIDHDRKIAEELFESTGCEVNPAMNEQGVDLTSVWHRAFRYRAEREAAANALRVREGKPIEKGSVCRDAQWAFDGTTLRLSRHIRTTSPDKPMPLVLNVKRSTP